MLKGRSLKSCVALVVFCCSLLLACISPAWADQSYPDTSAEGFALYAGGFQQEPVFQTKPCYVPFSGSHTFTILHPPQNTTAPIRIAVPQIEPVDYNRTLVINIGYACSGGTSSGVNDAKRTNRSNRDVEYYTGGSTKHILAGGSTGGYVSPISSYNGQSYNYRISVPPNCTSFWTNTADDWILQVYDPSPGFMLVSYGAFLVGSGDASVVDLVESILAEVQQINATTGDMNSKLSSCLNALNAILAQCKALNADTDTIITILNAVKSQLVTLNGKVDSIYTLLKDALKEESAAVDKKAQETGEQIMQRVDSEQYWSDKNTENFDALDMGNWKFSDGVVGALPTVGNLFKSLWDSIGDATLIFIFPLMLGISLVIVGRVSRTAGKGAKKGGGDDG